MTTTLERGDRVRVTSGYFRGKTGVVDTIAADDGPSRRARETFAKSEEGVAQAAADSVDLLSDGTAPVVPFKPLGLLLDGVVTFTAWHREEEVTRLRVRRA